MKKYIFFVFLALFIASCSTQTQMPKSVRTGRSIPRISDSRRARADAKIKEEKEEQSQTTKSESAARKSKEDLATINKRFSDTTVIELDGQLAEKSLEIVKKFDGAVEKFDKEFYQDACSEFFALAETFNKKDSLYFEAEFYTCECLIVNEKFEEAEARLFELVANLDCTPIILEKSILRIGHIYCAKGNKEKANYYFDQLKRLNSESFFLPYADCEGFNN